MEHGFEIPGAFSLGFRVFRGIILPAMRYSFRIAILMVLVSVLISGCATMRYPNAYKIEGKEFKEFKEVDDDRALKVVALIYNVKPQAWEDGIARSLALDEYLGLLKKRKSQYIKNSGIFDMKYDKVKLASWKDADLVRLYDVLAPKAACYYEDCAPELSETQNAERILYLTAVHSVVGELKKRNTTQKVLEVATQVVGGALILALSFI